MLATSEASRRGTRIADGAKRRRAKRRCRMKTPSNCKTSSQRIKRASGRQCQAQPHEGSEQVVDEERGRQREEPCQEGQVARYSPREEPHGEPRGEPTVHPGHGSEQPQEQR